MHVLLHQVFTLLLQLLLISLVSYSASPHSNNVTWTPEMKCPLWWFVYWRNVKSGNVLFKSQWIQSQCLLGVWETKSKTTVLKSGKLTRSWLCCCVIDCEWHCPRTCLCSILTRLTVGHYKLGGKIVKWPLKRLQHALENGWPQCKLHRICTKLAEMSKGSHVLRHVDENSCLAALI